MNKLTRGILYSLLVIPAAASAQPVHEGFSDYTNLAELLTTNGGVGFLDEWDRRSAVLGSGAGLPTSDSAAILPQSLHYVDGAGNLLATNPGSLFLTGEFGNVALARSLDLQALPNNGPDPQTGKTTYVSFLARRSGPPADPQDPVYGGDYPWGDNLYPRAAGFNFFSNDNGDAVQLFVGGISNALEDVWRLNGQDLDGVSKDPLINEPFGEGNRIYLVVIRIDHGQGDGGADEINMYLNPLMESEGLNSIGVTADWETRDDPLYLPGHWIGVEAGDASSNRPHAEFTFDEFRIGQSWASVLPHVDMNPCGFTVSGGYAYTGKALGWLYLADGPWYFSTALDDWVYIEDPARICESGGAWYYLPVTGN